jgi:small subunit ribosomal protein S27Ae
MAKEKAASKTKKSYSISKAYEIKGDTLERKNTNCPKCGPGVFLAKHRDRVTCGKCGYTEKK